jgi:hypothetical protein
MAQVSTCWDVWRPASEVHFASGSLAILGDAVFIRFIDCQFIN